METMKSRLIPGYGYATHDGERNGKPLSSKEYWEKIALIKDKETREWKLQERAEERAEAIRRLEQLVKLLEHTMTVVRRKRGMRPSEKAMTLANYAEDVLAIKRGIASLKENE